jgi:hypothetical protein
MSNRVRLHGPHSVKLFLSTELKARITAVADSLDRPIAEVCRQLLWMGLPIAEGMQAAHLRGSRWWLANTGFSPEDLSDTLEETA